MESDPGLFTRILQLANSPFYAEIDKIVSMRVANRRLGHPNLGMDVLPGEQFMTGMLHGVGKLLD